MVKSIQKLFILLSLTLTALAGPAFADDGSYVIRSYSTETLGTRSGGSVAAGNPAGTQKVQTKANVTMIGKSLNALTATVAPEDQINIGGTAFTTVYSFGKAVLSDAWSISSNGYNNVKIGLAPTEVRVPFVVYPVGPLTLNVGGGVRFQANLDATLTPEIAVPVQESTLGVQMVALAQAAGFVEAYAALVVVRGGVGGQVNLIDGHLDVNGRLSFNGTDKPVMLVNGIVNFFNGRFYAFVDLFGFITLGWKRLVDENIYNWNGVCYAMGYLQCPAN